MERQPTSAPLRPHSSESGFTAIELLVVIVLAGVLAAIAAPSWFAFANRQRANAVRSDVVQTLRNAQQDAIQLRQARRVQVDTTADSPTLNVGSLFFNPDGTENLGNSTPQILGGEANNTGQIVVEAYAVEADGTRDLSVDSVTFDYQGLPLNRDNLPFVITVSSGPGTSRQCVIVANLLGNFKLANNADCDNPPVGIN